MTIEDSFPFSLKQLILSFQQKPPVEDIPKDVARIKVNDTISRVSFFYEKFRNAIDYKEEHLLRKNAIERILKRRLVPGAKIEKVSRQLIYELIRGRYLPNNAVPETKILEIAHTINNYVLLLHEIVRDFKGQNYYDYRKWILGIASVELEGQLVSAHRDEAIVDFAFRTVTENLEWKDDSISQKDKNTLLYLAIHRALIKSDEPILIHHLWNFEFGEWRNAEPETIQRAGREMESFRSEVNRYLNHRLNEYLFQKIKKTSVLFQILRDVIEEDPQAANDVLTDQEAFDTKIRNVAAQRYKKARLKLERSVKRSLVYLLFTKTALALLVELPYDRYFVHEVNYVPLGVNILFHPIFLFFLAAIINTPGNKNTERIIQGIHGILSTNSESRPKWRIRPRKRKKMLMAIFQIIYAVAFLLTFGGLVSFLALMKFNAVSILFFLFFLTVVSFLGIKLRQDNKELQMQVHKEGFTSLLIDFFTIPVVRVGRWLSLKAPKVNLFVFILDVIIEAPFKSFINVSEEWVDYMKEKKDETY
ncbi:MAG: hypothetical protein COY66_06765 [Candidatus Kerfeldbacteria bacterium CG_4_10_14_0_8_um_filter_42_10]|uniref:Uncharacterized protein n=1 Tax=Candidatus Kerfeldbacteria bacterium CG_4_10_14_0_8_um_filter_42_10 TaxID=2014248 RepID=A0A2M7RFF2_9BACT|nr:MAG: hypothetical protein COY66_06765 [Candidatus Kerfeldbacteria bacterium CG_4_10_14_0_8_um_filter_42_10]